jgi:Flp pilus assembly protein CpaB
MQTQVRPPRQRSSGGRTLMLLGLVLALAAAGLVLYVTSSVQGTFVNQTESVVVAAQNLPAGTILTLNNSKAPAMRISNAFAVEPMDKKLVPADAYIFTNQDALNTQLNNQVVKEAFLAGDILRTTDPRLATLGQTSGTSLTNINPLALPNGSVLYTLPQKNGDLGLQPGDTVDIIATGASTGATTQNQPKSLFILSKVLIYAVDVPTKGDILVVLTEPQVLLLTSAEHSNVALTIVIRKPGDPTNPITNPPVAGP